MATFADLVRANTDLEEPVISHLQRLVAAWGVLSDLCFSDLLLYAPATERDGTTAEDGWSWPRPAPPALSPPPPPAPEAREAGMAVSVPPVPHPEALVENFVVLGQVRPTTSRTLHPNDMVGRVMPGTERPLIGRGWRLGSVVEGEVEISTYGERARMVCIPVRWQDEMVAVLTRESALTVGRRPGELERTYVEVFDRLARMISQGTFPYPVDDAVTGDLPRVGDGVVVLDASGRVDYASPNAVNAVHRMGVSSSIDGLRLEEAGLVQAAVEVAYDTRLPATEEVSRGPDAAIVIRCVPLLDHNKVTGAVVLLRDVTELRRRDRLLLSKDAAIREVHHRVKNNLQTISSLLRLQARRLPGEEGRHALLEAERRVRSIALVHEILSRDTVDQVHFNDILPSLVRMAEDLGSQDRPVLITTAGDAGDVPASIATPLAVVVTELLQNAAEHAYPLDGPLPVEAIEVTIRLERTDQELVVTVVDNGVGLPPGFRIDETPSLGLSIVRNLVSSQLSGRISMRSDQGTVVELIVPLDIVDDDLENL